MKWELVFQNNLFPAPPTSCAHSSGEEQAKVRRCPQNAAIAHSQRAAAAAGSLESTTLFPADLGHIEWMGQVTLGLAMPPVRQVMPA